MNSPFASLAIQAALPLSAFQPIDESRAKINKYVRTFMRIRRTLSKTTSEQANDTKRNKDHMYIPDVGTVMVTHKKPFKVRFSE